MSIKLDKELNKLNVMLIEMGQLVESAIEKSVKSLRENDRQLTEEVLSIEEDINEKEELIQNLCLKILLVQQPVATDLRVVSSALKMITDLERIGDQAADIAEIAVHCIGKDYMGKLKLIEEMSKIVIQMVRDCIEAYVKKDVQLVKKVIESDDIVDEYFVNAREKVVELISKGTLDSELIVDLLMISKYLERIGDHAVNVSEWVEYSITGEYKSN